MKQTIPVVGMACSACSANVERKLQSLAGIRSVSVNLVGRTVLVDYDPSVITLLQMKQEISNLGYDLVVETDRSASDIERREFALLRCKVLISWLLSVSIMAVSMGWIPMAERVAYFVAIALSVAGMAGCGAQFYISAWRRLRHHTANMDTLVALSTLTAFVHGVVWHTHFDACLMIIAFVLTGRMLEEKAKDGTARSIRQLMGMAPKTARLVEKDGSLTQVPLSTIEKGDILEVRAGEKVPVDGIVTYAESFMTSDAAYVDEAMITGEPTPAEKQKGSQVLAGTIPSQGKLRLKAQQVGEQTALAGIIRMVQEAQGSKAPVQRIVDKASRVFVPVVAAISLLTFLIWWIFGGNEALPQAVLSAVSVLVIACPCAMGLATPTALMVGIGKAVEKQILVKDASALENIRKIDALVTDKTGTLTIPNGQVDFTKASDLSLDERETLKPHAREAMLQLQQQGIEVWMVSGDKPRAAAYWAERAGIPADHVFTIPDRPLMPRDKEKLVRRLQQEGKTVAMIGDGINDTQALAQADVSIAIGKGTDVAMDVAQMTLMSDDLLRLPDAVKLSRKTVHMIWQNLFWAFIYNIVCIPLAAGLPYLFGINFQITPMWSAALMAMSGLSVVLNSLRLRYVR